MFLRCLRFCSDFFVMPENGSIRKLRKIIKLMTSHAVTQTFSINILPDISKNNDNQTMKFDQEKYFSSKIMQKMRPGNYFQTSFCPFKKLYMN